MDTVSKGNNFWAHLDELLSESEIIIDRPKGSSHPRYPQIVYPMDYGYLKGTKSSDDEGVDVWIGSDAGHLLDAIICTVDLLKRDAEIKLLIGCTPPEKLHIESFYSRWPNLSGVLVERKDNQ